MNRAEAFPYAAAALQRKRSVKECANCEQCKLKEKEAQVIQQTSSWLDHRPPSTRLHEIYEEMNRHPTPGLQAVSYQQTPEQKAALDSYIEVNNLPF